MGQPSNYSLEPPRQLLARKLKPGGQFYLASDQREFISWARESVEMASDFARQEQSQTQKQASVLVEAPDAALLDVGMSEYAESMAVRGRSDHHFVWIRQ